MTTKQQSLETLDAMRRLIATWPDDVQCDVRVESGLIWLDRPDFVKVFRGQEVEQDCSGVLRTTANGIRIMSLNPMRVTADPTRVTVE